MSKRLVQVLYNPGSINSVGMDCPEDVANTANVSVSLRDNNPGLLLGLVESLKLGHASTPERHQQLIQIKKHLARPLAPAERMLFLRLFNSSVQVLAENSSSDATTFQACVQIVSMVKELVESNPQILGADSRAEWVELEKSIYHLSHWEGQLEFYWSSLN